MQTDCVHGYPGSQVSTCPGCSIELVPKGSERAALIAWLHKPETERMLDNRGIFFDTLSPEDLIEAIEKADL